MKVINETRQTDQPFGRPAPTAIAINCQKLSAEQALRDDIDKLKDPKTYRERFASETVQQLSQAIDVLHRLQVEALGDASHVGYEILRDAKLHLDQSLRDYLSVEVDTLLAS